MREYIGRSILVLRLSEQQQREIASYMDIIKFRAHQLIHEEGDTIDNCYLIGEGRFDADVFDPQLNRTLLIGTINLTVTEDGHQKL